MPILRRFRRRKAQDTESEGGTESSKKPSPVVKLEESPSPIPSTSRFIPSSSTPVGSLIAESDSLQIDHAETRQLARDANIQPQATVEIVPGKSIRRDSKGRIHIKIVFYGPSLSGKTTALRWLFANVRSLSKGKIIEISDERGRTTFFDFVPVTTNNKIVFDVFTVAGQRRHASNRIRVMRDVDGIIFMADSAPEQMNENLASIQELRIVLGTDRLAMLPIIVALNKRDLPNALPVEYMLDVLDLDGYPTFETIATTGKNLIRMFQRILRDALIFKVGI